MSHDIGLFDSEHEQGRKGVIMSAKGNSYVASLIAIGLLFTAFGAEAAGYSGGSGTEEDPYKIGKAADWTALMETDTDWDKHFLLIGDIDFAGASLTPIGTQSVPFSGTFDGANHKVSNGVLYIFSECGGLLGYMGSRGAIRNVGVRNVAVLSGGNCDTVGGLLGYNGGGKITSCYTTGEVTGDEYIGGLVGMNNKGGVVTSCYFTGAVTGGWQVGGLVGSNRGTVTACYSTGAITGNAEVGGLVGNNLGIITFCYSTGTVPAGRGSFGGLVGYNDGGTVTSCYWNIDTSGSESSYGGVGCVTDDMTYPYAANAFFNWDFLKTWAADTDYSLNNGYPYLRGNEPTQETLAVTPIHHEVEASKGSTTSAVKTTALWAVTSDSNWAKVNPISGTGNGTITISYEANVGKERSATISVTGVDTNPGLVIVKVKQAVGIEGEGEAQVEEEGEIAGEGEKEGEAPVEEEGETVGEGETTGEGEFLEGESSAEGEGEVPDDSSCGCNGKTWVTPKHLLGDWLLIGLSLMVLGGACLRRKV